MEAMPPCVCRPTMTETKTEHLRVHNREVEGRGRVEPPTFRFARTRDERPPSRAHVRDLHRSTDPNADERTWMRPTMSPPGLPLPD